MKATTSSLDLAWDPATSTLRMVGASSPAVGPHLRDALVQALGPGGESLVSPSSVVIDLSGLDQLDTSGLQLLWSASRRAATQGQTLRLHGIPGPVQSFLAEMGIPIRGSEGVLS